MVCQAPCQLCALCCASWRHGPLGLPQSLKGLSRRRATWPLARGVSRWQPMMFRVTRDVIDFTRFSTPLSVTCKAIAFLDRD